MFTFAKHINHMRLYRFLFLISCFQCTFLLWSQERELVWEKKADYGGRKVENAIGFSMANMGFLCLGTDDANFYRDCWQYDAKLDQWKKLNFFPGEQRKWAVSFVIGNRAYITTGLNNLEKDTKDLWEYNSDKDTWVQKADLDGDARSKATGFAISGKGYVCMGVTKGSSGYNNDVWEYDAKNNSWNRKADFPKNAKGRIEASSFVVKDKAYVLLGGNLFKLTSATDVWEFNPVKNTWTKKADFPGKPRIGAIGFQLVNHGYIYGGFNGTNLSYDDLWEYYPVSDKWTQLPNSPAGPRNNTVCFVIDSTAYIGTGNVQSNLVESGKSNDFWKVTSIPAKVLMDYNAKLLYEDKDKKLPLTDQGVSLMSKEKKIIQTTKTDDEGLFAFKHIDVEGKYEVVLEETEKIPEGAKVAIAKPSGKIIQNLEKGESGQFSFEVSKLELLEEDDSYFNLQYFMKSKDREITITTYIYYPVGSAELSSEAKELLYQVITSLNQYPELKVEISSHTDSKGDDASNLLLSEKRAVVVVDYLNVNNIDLSRVSGKGFGETKIINRCKNKVDCSEEEHKLNRRTEFKFIKQNK